MKKSALYQKSGGRPGSGSPVKLGWGTGARIVGGAFTGKYVKDEYDEKTKEDRNKPWYEKGGEVLWDNTGGLGSPIKISGLARAGASKVLPKVGKYIKKNWKKLIAGEVAWYSAEKILKNTKISPKRAKKNKAYYDRSTNMLGTPKW